MANAGTVGGKGVDTSGSGLGAKPLCKPLSWCKRCLLVASKLTHVLSPCSATVI